MQIEQHLPASNLPTVDLGSRSSSCFSGTPFGSGELAAATKRDQQNRRVVRRLLADKLDALARAILKPAAGGGVELRHGEDETEAVEASVERVELEPLVLAPEARSCDEQQQERGRDAHAGRKGKRDEEERESKGQARGKHTRGRARRAGRCHLERKALHDRARVHGRKPKICRGVHHEWCNGEVRTSPRPYRDRLDRGE